MLAFSSLPCPRPSSLRPLVPFVPWEHSTTMFPRGTISSLQHAPWGPLLRSKHTIVCKDPIVTVRLPSDVRRNVNPQPPGLDLVFLGTSANRPSHRRNMSSLAVQWGASGSIWLFDCGDGTQRQLMNVPLTLSRIDRLFITHVHGDHMFGLPSLFAILNCTAPPADRNPLHIYGPPGLRAYVRHSILFTSMKISIPFAVHELHTAHGLGGDYPLPSLQRPPGSPPEQNIYMEKDKTWDILSLDMEKSKVHVRAGPVKHSVPSWGFVIDEEDAPGTLDAQKVTELGLRPGPLYKDLKAGRKVVTPGGCVVDPATMNILGPKIKGRKVVIVGDTCDASGVESLAKDADVLVHEATLEDSLLRRARQYMHSTPSMAVSFAKRIQAKVLVLNHFSPRYHSGSRKVPDQLEDPPPQCQLDIDAEGIRTCVEELRQEALEAAGSDSNLSVVCAEDWMRICIRRKPRLPSINSLFD